MTRKEIARLLWSVSNSDWLLGSVIAGFVLYAILFGVPSGDFYYDEGHYAAVAKLLLNGWEIYQDIQLNYTPNVIILYELLFRAFGPDLIYVRYISVLIFSIAAFLTSVITANTTGSQRLGTIVACLFLVTVAAFDGSRLTASTLAILTSLLAVMAHIKILSGKSLWWPFLLGACLSATFFTKQNIGVYDLIAHLILFVFGSVKGLYAQGYKEISGMAVVGATIIASPYLIEIARNPALISYIWEDLVLSTGHYASTGSISFPTPTDLIGSLSPNYVISNISLYSIFFFLISAYLFFANRSQMSAKTKFICGLLVFLALFNYLQVFPRVGLSHYIRSSTYLLVAGSILAYFSWKSRHSSSHGPLVISLLTIFIHSLSPVAVTGSKVINSVPKKFSELPYSESFKQFSHETDLQAVIEVLEKKEDLENSQVVFMRYPQLYYFSRFEPINRNLELQPFKLSLAQEQAFLSDSEVKDVKVIVIGPWVQSSDFQLIDEAISHDYQLTHRIGVFEVWSRNSDENPEHFF